jgi:hypothetical protein
VCLDTFAWARDGSDLFELDPDTMEYRPIDLAGQRDPRKREVRLRSAFLLCPNPTGDAEPHYLPVLYGRYRKPLVIGLVGGTQAGKTHLLAAMMGEIESNGLESHGLTAVPLDMIRHRLFHRDFVQPLYRGTRLTYTVPTDLPEFVDALIISRTGETGGHPVAFFDVSGEQLAKVGKGERFLAAVDGLIFVVDPEQALRMPGLAEDPGVLGDLAFSNVLNQLFRQETLLDIPAVVVVSKSDRLRFTHPADRWLAAAAPPHLDAELIRMESRDVYAFLHQHGAQGWLLPASRCRRVTLHFASATGGRSTDESFPRGVRPQRVLNPLIAMLAMTGVIDGPEAREVGR